MGLWHSLRSWIGNLRRSTDERPTPRIFFSPKTNAGALVNHDTALNYAAVWACVRVITESLSQMAWHVFRQSGDARERMANHPADWVLSTQANQEMSAFTLREILVAWALTWGNGYAEIERDLAGRVAALWPIAPDRVRVDRDRSGQLVYDTLNKSAPNTVLLPSEMFHLHGLGFDGIQGYSVIGLARQSIGMGLAAEQYGSRLFANDSRPSGVLKHPGGMATLSDPAIKRMKEDWQRIYAGQGQHEIAILEEGMEFQAIGIPPDDAQFLETRRFQIQEISRWFRVPPHKIADLSRATFSNIEHQAIEFVVDTLVPWAMRLEQEANIKLFGLNRQTLFTKLNVASLLRGDQQSRYTAYSTGRQWGWLSVNDVRRLEDMNPLPSHIGDVYLSPTNMTALPLIPSASPTVLSGPQNRPVDPEDALRALLAAQVAAHRNGTEAGATS